MTTQAPPRPRLWDAGTADAEHRDATTTGTTLDSNAMVTPPMVMAGPNAGAETSTVCGENARTAPRCCRGGPVSSGSSSYLECY